MEIDNASNTAISETKRSTLRSLLKYAVLAPSGHNTQPWLFRPTEKDDLYLIADRTRALPVVDPHDRELIISCGAALDHLDATQSQTAVEQGLSYDERINKYIAEA